MFIHGTGESMSFKTHLEVKVLRKGHAEDQSYHWLEMNLSTYVH